MSCCSSFPSCHCGVFTETACGDPGLETSGRHLAVYDNQFCSRRLANPVANGFLTGAPNGFTFTADPQVLLTDLELSENEGFYGIVTNTDTGRFRRLVPAAGVDGFMVADGNGGWFIKPASEVGSTVPDPLTLTTLNASNVNTSALTVSGLPTFTGLISGTIATTIGLNGSNQLVKGTSSTISVAQFYESNGLASPATPNFTYPANASANVQIGNEISDPDGIAHVVSQEVIEVDKAGTYSIEWYGQYQGYSINGNVSAGTPYNPGLWLTVNGTLISLGNTQTYQDRNVGGTAMGKVANITMAVGAQIRIRGNGSMSPAPSTGLRGVTLILTKHK